jgi:ABC-2 type transport system ATP-binding protein
LRRLEIEFGSDVSVETFGGLPGILDIRIEGRVLKCTVQGSLDGLIKIAARFEVSNVRTVETSLEEIFMAYYGSGTAVPGAGARSADGAGNEAGHAAA